LAGEFWLAGLARRLAGGTNAVIFVTLASRLPRNRPQNSAFGARSHIDQEDVQPVFQSHSI